MPDPLKLNFADPDTGTELTAYVEYGPTEFFDEKVGMTMLDGPDEISAVEELTNADTGEPVVITDSIRKAIQEAFKATIQAESAALRDAIDYRHIGI